MVYWWMLLWRLKGLPEGLRGRLLPGRVERGGLLWLVHERKLLLLKALAVLCLSHEEAFLLLARLDVIERLLVLMKRLGISESQHLLLHCLMILNVGLPILVLDREGFHLVEAITVGQTGDTTLLKLNAHDLVLVLEAFDLVNAAGHLLKLGILLLEVEELLVNVGGAPVPLEVQDLLKVLYLLLQLLDVGIVRRAHLVRHHLHKDLLRPVREFQSAYCLLDVVNHWRDGRYQGRLGVAAQRVLQQTRDL